LKSRSNVAASGNNEFAAATLSFAADKLWEQDGINVRDSNCNPRSTCTTNPIS
jgi:hypothetical protein